MESETIETVKATDACGRCGGSGIDPTSARERGCMLCPEGRRVEQELARIDARERAFAEDATGQDAEAFEG